MNDISENYYAKFLKILKKHGFSEDDFVLESEDQSDYTCDGLNPTVISILIRRLSTSKEKAYQLDQEVNWAIEFESDLTKGFFNK